MVEIKDDETGNWDIESAISVYSLAIAAFCLELDDGKMTGILVLNWVGSNLLGSIWHVEKKKAK